MGRQVIEQEGEAAISGDAAAAPPLNCDHNCCDLFCQCNADMPEFKTYSFSCSISNKKYPLD